LRRYVDPVGAPNLFSAGKTTAYHRYLMMDLGGDENPLAKRGEKIEPTNPGEGNQR
jgi:hypothetical protein